MIYKFYKKEGETMGQMLAQFKAEYNVPESEKVTYSGRLDPLAMGEVLILTGEDVHRKDDFNKLNKVYSFTIMFGVQTDTGDVLGVLQKRSLLNRIFRNRLIKLKPRNIRQAILKFKKTYTQKYPMFSSFNVGGKPLWQLARDKNLPNRLPDNQVTIYEIELFQVYTKKAEQILLEIRNKINTVDGDFRQAVIDIGWQALLQKNPDKEFIFADCRATVSSGTYIRVLVEDIGKYLCTNAVAFAIKRDEIVE